MPLLLCPYLLSPYWTQKLISRSRESMLPKQRESRESSFPTNLSVWQNAILVSECPVRCGLFLSLGQKFNLVSLQKNYLFVLLELRDSVASLLKVWGRDETNVTQKPEMTPQYPASNSRAALPVLPFAAPCILSLRVSHSLEAFNATLEPFTVFVCGLC